jgi:hypothetical protein
LHLGLEHPPVSGARSSTTNDPLLLLLPYSLLPVPLLLLPHPSPNPFIFFFVLSLSLSSAPVLSRPSSQFTLLVKSIHPPIRATSESTNRYRVVLQPKPGVHRPASRTPLLVSHKSTPAYNNLTQITSTRVLTSKSLPHLFKS